MFVSLLARGIDLAGWGKMRAASLVKKPGYGIAVSRALFPDCSFAICIHDFVFISRFGFFFLTSNSLLLWAEAVRVSLSPLSVLLCSGLAPSSNSLEKRARPSPPVV
ncbi:predicted protein [Plenodomus lingam JN3]|uniref:Predicted protein n=1 Tax=Leptosphaeria maculans (strain JN3 / isolate v23.1.3 / race Av1-4-5-6-7-8) TaxID=985895 RepID=E5A0A4_LEPMJ|nr:predicted protein [Plenodomus lingam JN3]CBX96964.1 predicted protein [Plenodomus lingam JN3]